MCCPTTTVPADRSAAERILSKEIERALSTLTERERDVVKLFFGIGINHGLTLEEIGAKFDLTRERVRQIKEKAIRRLRHTSRSKLLKAYLGLIPAVETQIPPTDPWRPWKKRPVTKPG
jgi:RNA polymerase primary sigma factor